MLSSSLPCILAPQGGRFILRFFVTFISLDARGLFPRQRAAVFPAAGAPLRRLDLLGQPDAPRGQAAVFCFLVLAGRAPPAVDRAAAAAQRHGGVFQCRQNPPDDHFAQGHWGCSITAKQRPRHAVRVIKRADARSRKPRPFSRSGNRGAVMHKTSQHRPHPSLYNKTSNLLLRLGGRFWVSEKGSHR